jgi:hypothetical protein
LLATSPLPLASCRGSRYRGPAWFRRIEADLSIKEEERNLMRRASTCLALLGLAVLGVPSVAAAAPAVTFKASAQKIPGFPHTGNILGAGALEQVEWTIKGTEYGGFPAPLVGVNVYEPAGTKLHPQGFTTCSLATLKSAGAKGCSSKSRFATGSANGVVSFGESRVEESTKISGFFVPGGYAFYTQGVSPVLLEFISNSHITNSGAPYGPKIATDVPLVETVPGAPDASVFSIKVSAGAAIKKNGKAIYYGTLPKKCPKGGFPLKSELIFANISALPSRVPGETVTTTYNAPCPRK